FPFDVQTSIMTDLYYLSQTDGAGDWREKEAKDLTDLVQRRITYLQVKRSAGTGLNYLTCLGMYFNTGEANDKDVQVVELPIVDSLHPRPPYLPLAVPEDLADRLIRVHGDPAVWWVSQFVKYLIRPQPWLEKEIEEATRKLGFKHPVIGVHVRRTDKVGTEAAFHPIEEYMVHVEERFELLARRMLVDKKRVYLATDDPSLLQEAKSKYPNYEFISDNSISWSAGLHNRYTENSLRGVILDIHFLSQADFLVCTFSSQSIFELHSILELYPHSPSLCINSRYFCWMTVFKKCVKFC
uniref:Fucosyltransferase 8 n=1 Tax=Pavo cristatus TaxID=9049 RepID=A0A8C9FZ33_PAVCR